jgi:predicted TIM-barrel fold metal-dependent hydrolase
MPMGPSGTDAYENAAPTREAMKAYFKHDYETKTMPKIAQYYRERKIGCVIFTVDSEAATGQRRCSNEEVARLCAENDDLMIPFASIDPCVKRSG